MKNDSKEPIVAPSKKTYSTPALVEYGSIAKLTQGGGSAVASDGGSMAMTCL